MRIELKKKGSVAMMVSSCCAVVVMASCFLLAVESFTSSPLRGGFVRLQPASTRITTSNKVGWRPIGGLSSAPIVDEEILEDADDIGKASTFGVDDETTAVLSTTPLPPVVDDSSVIVGATGSSSSSNIDEIVSSIGEQASSNVTEFLLGGANNFLEVSDLLEATDEVEEEESVVDSSSSSIDNVGAVLAAAEAAAESTLLSSTSDVVDSIPLIPGTTDDVGGVTTSTNIDNNIMESFVVEKEQQEEGQGGDNDETPVEILSVKSVVGESAVESIEAPSVKKILRFAIPAIGVWLCSPLLSLIDTSAVGVLSGTVQQAALNPAVAVTDYAALLIAFLFTATTNLVASAQETDRGVEGKPKTSNAFISALQLSGFVGLGLGTVLFAFAKPLLNAIIGNDGISPQVFSAAMKYVRIRAIGMPAAAIIGSAQAACLGMQDIRSPLYVLLAAAGVNFISDMTLVGSSSPLFGGAAGAAWATVFSQYAAVACFVHWLCNKPRTNKPKVINLTKNIMELMETEPPSSSNSGESSSASSPPRRNKLNEAIMSLQRKTSNSKNKINVKVKSLTQKIGSTLAATLKKKKATTNSSPKPIMKNDDDNFSVRGFLAGKFSGRDFLSVPSKESLAEFAPYVIPVTTTQVGRVSGYVAMSHVVSSSLGTLSMAAQQIIVSIFYCLTPIADSLNLIAQSFVPGLAEKKDSREKAAALKTTFFNFMKASTIFNMFMVGGVACIPLLTKFFTADPSVITLVNSAVPLLMGIFSIHGIVMTSEGILLGQKDLGFLGKSYAGFFFALPYFMLRVKKAALSGCTKASIGSLWQIFLGYNVFRLFTWISRIAFLQYRTERNGKKEEVQLI